MSSGVLHGYTMYGIFPFFILNGQRVYVKQRMVTSAE